MHGNFVTGTVLAVSDTALSIRAEGIAVTEGRIWINPTLTGQLSVGDRVVLLTEDHQSYSLICKVVKYG